MQRSVIAAMILGLAACGDKPSIAPAAQAAAPKAIAAAVEEKPDAKLHGIDAVAAAGIVTLWGTTVSAKEKERAAEIARNVEGVEAVENRLEVVAGS